MNQSSETPLLCLRAARPLPGMKPVYALTKTPITIGRHPSNDINIPVEAVSRFHARIEKRGDRLVLIDLNSSNGTYVNNRRIDEVALSLGQKIAFGNVEFQCEGIGVKPATSKDSAVKTPVEFVTADRKRSRLLMEAEAGKRDTTPLLKLVEARGDREALLEACRKLGALYKLSDLLNSAPEEENLLDAFMDLLFEVVPADCGVILMREGPEDDLKIKLSRARHGERADRPIAVSRTIIDRCMQERVAILSQDALTDRRFKESESVHMHEIRSTLAVPLVTQRGNILGVLHLDTRESARAFDDDDLNFVTSLANDLALFIENRRMAEENQRNQEMAAIGEVITDLAHSIKNVLLLAEGGIKLMDRLIDEGDLERTRQTWALTQKTLARISALVKEMLDYSSAPRISKTLCNLNQIVRETCESFRDEFERKGVAVKLRLDKRIGDAMLDAQNLERSLVNLLVNACEAIDHGNGQITVTTELRPSRDLVLIVDDNGAGIPPEDLPRVFYPRFSTKTGRGSGLGLAMVKKWVAAVGASVHVYSTPGKGTRFVITLPRESIEPPDKAEGCQGDKAETE